MNYAVINGESVENVILFDDTPSENFDVGPGRILISAPEGVGPGHTFVNGVFIAPPQPESPAPEPIRVSKIEFRRLLKPKEAAVFRLLEAAPKITAAELTTVFTTGDVELQIRVAVEDAIQQFNLLPEFIELNHPDTAEFLGIMSLAGMFDDDSAIRIPQILAGNPPE